MFLSLFRFKSSRTSQVRPLLNWKKKFPEISKKCLANQDVLKKVLMWLKSSNGSMRQCEIMFPVIFALLTLLIYFYGSKSTSLPDETWKKWKIRSTETNIFSNFEEKGSENWYLSDATFSVTFTSPKSVNLKTLNVNMPEKLLIGFVCNSQPEKISFLVAASLLLELEEFCEFMRNQ